MKNYTLNFPTYHNTNHAFVFGRQSRGVEYFTVVVSILTIAVGVVANIMMCLTIAVSASLRTAMNTYVLSIGLVDLLTSALLLPLRVVLDRKLFYSEGENMSHMFCCYFRSLNFCGFIPTLQKYLFTLLKYLFTLLKYLFTLLK